MLWRMLVTLVGEGLFVNLIHKWWYVYSISNILKLLIGSSLWLRTRFIICLLLQSLLLWLIFLGNGIVLPIVWESGLLMIYVIGTLLIRLNTQLLMGLPHHLDHLVDLDRVVWCPFSVCICFSFSLNKFSPLLYFQSTFSISIKIMQNIINKYNNYCNRVYLNFFSEF